MKQIDQFIVLLYRTDLVLFIASSTATSIRSKSLLTEKALQNNEPLIALLLL